MLGQQVPPHLGNPGAEQGHSCCCLSWESGPSCAGPALEGTELLHPRGSSAREQVQGAASPTLTCPRPDASRRPGRRHSLRARALLPRWFMPPCPHGSRPWSMVENHPLEALSGPLGTHSTLILGGGLRSGLEALEPVQQSPC